MTESTAAPKRNTNSQTEHSINLRRQTAAKAQAKKRANGEIVDITLHLKRDLAEKLKAAKAQFGTWEQTIEQLLKGQSK